jgi:hypothetical protein
MALFDIIVAEGTKGLISGTYSGAAKTLIEKYYSGRQGSAPKAAGPVQTAVRDLLASLDELASRDDIPVEVRIDIEKAANGSNILERALEREARRMANEAQVIEYATEQLPTDAEVHPFDEDFLESFSAHAERARGERFQRLWAQLLTLEAQNPGSVTKRVMNELELLGPSDVDLLKKVARLSVLDFGIVLSPKSHLTAEEYVHAITLGLVASPEGGLRVSPVDGCFVVKMEADEQLLVEPIYCGISGESPLTEALFEASARLTQTGRELVRLAFSGLSEAALVELINCLSTTGPTCVSLSTASNSVEEIIDARNQISRRRLDEEISALGAQRAIDAALVVTEDQDVEPYYFNSIRASANIALIDFTDDGIRQHFLDYGVSPKYLWRHYRDYLMCHRMPFSPHLQEKSQNPDGTINFAAAEVREWFVEHGIPNEIYDLLD